MYDGVAVFSNGQKKKLASPSKPKESELIAKSRERNDSGEDAARGDSKSGAAPPPLVPLLTPPMSPSHKKTTSYYKHYFDASAARKDGTASDSELVCSTDREDSQQNNESGMKRRPSLNLSRRGDVAAEVKHVPWTKAAIHKRGQAAKKAASEVGLSKNYIQV